MLQQKKPDDFVIATGKQYSVKHFVNIVAKELNMKINGGKGINEKAYDKKENVLLNVEKDILDQVKFKHYWESIKS